MIFANTWGMAIISTACCVTIHMSVNLMMERVLSWSGEWQLVPGNSELTDSLSWQQPLWGEQISKVGCGMSEVQQAASHAA